MQLALTPAMFIRLCVVLLLLACVSSAYAECGALEPKTSFGNRFSYGQDFPTDRSYKKVAATAARYMRVKLSARHPVPDGWLLSVRDANQRLVQTFSREDFVEAVRPEDGFVWTRRVPGKEVFLEFTGIEPAKNGFMRIVEYIAMREDKDKAYYSLQTDGDEKYMPLFKDGTPMQRQQGEHVGIMLASWGTEHWCCTGVMVSPDLFLTSWHCGGSVNMPEDAYWNDLICSDMIIDLSWDGDDQSREFTCDLVEDKDINLDFALVRVKPIDRIGKVRPATVSLGSYDKDADIIIIHHPRCKQKQISRSCSSVEVVNEEWLDGRGEVARLKHNCDTEGGSSGAPVFDISGNVVALHHHGFDRDGECDPIDKVNKAITINQIWDEINEKLRREILHR